ncbi:MAG: dienelactone hydrolase family protein [Methylacidiphilales bacterium]|nr:dienelactone hydrolase family protein [Candidatus Methylacidiphilales bacterium]
MNPIKSILLLFIYMGVCQMALSEVVVKTVTYEHEGKAFKGSLVYNESVDKKRPGILVLHEWWGITPELIDKAKRLANDGYVAFVADLYGDAKTADHPEEAGKLMGELTSNKFAWRARALASLVAFKKQPIVDPKQIAAIGFCLGGNTALNMVYARHDIVAAVAFHSTLALPDSDDDLKGITTKILALQGAQDPFVPKGGIEKFTTELGATGLDWQLNLYPAEHAFTNPKADSKKIPGIKYNAKVYEQSWVAMHAMFSQIFN